VSYRPRTPCPATWVSSLIRPSDLPTQNSQRLVNHATAKVDGSTATYHRVDTRTRRDRRCAIASKKAKSMGNREAHRSKRMLRYSADQRPPWGGFSIQPLSISPRQPQQVGDCDNATFVCSPAWCQALSSERWTGDAVASIPQLRLSAMSSATATPSPRLHRFFATHPSAVGVRRSKHD
jgi:hypothetical protein